MTVPVLAAPVADRELSARRLAARRLSTARLGTARTLEAEIVDLWARIRSHRAAVCPLCQGEMEPEYGAGALPVAGRCKECGSALA